MTTQVSKIDLIIKVLESEVEGADAQIAKFGEALAQDPMTAFEWADKTILAVARKRNSMRLLSRIRLAKAKAENPEEGAQVKTADEIMENLDRDFSIETRQQRLSDSTSGSHRLMNQARSEVAAHWFDPTGSGRVTRKTVREALLELMG